MKCVSRHPLKISAPLKKASLPKQYSPQVQRTSTHYKSSQRLQNEQNKVYNEEVNSCREKKGEIGVWVAQRWSCVRKRWKTGHNDRGFSFLKSDKKPPDSKLVQFKKARGLFVPVTSTSWRSRLHVNLTYNSSCVGKDLELGKIIKYKKKIEHLCI